MRAQTAAPGAGTTERADAIDVVLFDLGGVIADFAGLPVMASLAGLSEEAAAVRWLTSPWVRQFESGNCSEQEFAAGVVTEWGFPLSPSQFLDSFVSWLGDPFDGAEQMVRDTGAQVTVGCLSNTNELHWRTVISEWPLTALFEHRFLSFELRAVKPDREVFERAVAALPVPPERVLFIDDNALNVEGALAAGLQAQQARGVAEARAVLARHALLG